MCSSLNSSPPTATLELISKLIESELMADLIVFSFGIYFYLFSHICCVNISMFFDHFDSDEAEHEFSVVKDVIVL